MVVRDHHQMRMEMRWERVGQGSDLKKKTHLCHPCHHHRRPQGQPHHVRLCAALLGEIFPHSVSPAENVTLIVSSKLQLNWNRTIYNRDDDVQQHIFKGTRETLGGAQFLSGCHPSGPALVPKTMYLRNLRAMQLYAYSDDINSRIYC